MEINIILEFPYFVLKVWEQDLIFAMSGVVKKKNSHPSGWKLNKQRLEEEYQNGKLEKIKYLKDYKGKPIDNNSIDIPRVIGNESTAYPTEKPLVLLERIIKASCPEGGVVFDPFCGCATTCVASEKLDRQWISIDVSHKAYELVKER